MTLLIRPQIAVGDGPIGYLAKLAEANRLTLGELVALGVVYDGEALRLQRCALPTGVDLALDDHLERVSTLLLEHPDSWVRRFRRCCPACLQNSPRWLVGWELLFADACPVHELWLVDRCSRCGELLSWSRGRLLACDCGQLLAQQQAVACPSGVARLAQALVDKLLEQPTDHALAPVEGLDVRQLQRLIRFLGSYADPEPGPRPQKIAGLDRIEISWRLTSLAAELLDRWPDALHQVLERMQTRHAESGGGRLFGRFGHFYTALYKGFPETEFQPIRDAFENYIAEHWRGALALRNRRFPPSILQRAAWIPANHACALLEVSRQRLVNLVKEGQIAGETRVGSTGREFIVVRRADVERQVEVLTQEVDLATAARLLGLSKRRMQALRPWLFPEARKTGNAGMPWAIPRKRIDALLKILKETENVDAPPSGQVALSHVLQFWAWTDRAVATLLSDVITGNVVPSYANRRTKGIGALILPIDGLRGWLATEHQGQCVCLTIPQVAERVGIKQEVAYAIVRAGLLRTKPLDAVTKRSTQCVEPTDLEEFGARYVFARDVAKQLGRSPKAVIEKLVLLGIKPACGPEINGCRQAVFEQGPEFERVLRRLSPK